MDFSAGRGTGDGVGASLGAAGARDVLVVFAGVTVAEGCLGVGFKGDLIVFSGVVLAAETGFFAVTLTTALTTGFTADFTTGFTADFATGLATGLPDLGAAILLAVAGLTATLDDAALGASLTTGFLAGAALTTAFALTAVGTVLAAGLAAGLAVAVLFKAVLTAAFAGVVDFFAFAFTECLLWEAASG